MNSEKNLFNNVCQQYMINLWHKAKIQSLFSDIKLDFKDTYFLKKNFVLKIFVLSLMYEFCISQFCNAHICVSAMEMFCSTFKTKTFICCSNKNWFMWSVGYFRAQYRDHFWTISSHQNWTFRGVIPISSKENGMLSCFKFARQWLIKMPVKKYFS